MRLGLIGNLLALLASLRGDLVCAFSPGGHLPAPVGPWPGCRTGTLIFRYVGGNARSMGTSTTWWVLLAGGSAGKRPSCPLEVIRLRFDGTSPPKSDQEES